MAQSLSKPRQTAGPSIWLPGLVGIGVGVAAAALVGYTVTGPHARAPFSPQQWAQATDERGAVRNFTQVLKEVADKGLDPSLRPQLWPLLLEVYRPDSTLQDRQAQHAHLTQVYRQYLNMCEDLEAQWLMAQSVGLSSDATRPAGVNGEHLRGLGVTTPVAEFYEAHRLIVTDALRTDFKLSSSSSSSTWLPSRLLPIGSNSPTATSPTSSQHGDAPPQFVGGWTSTLAANHLEQANHLNPGNKHQITRLVPLLCAYAVHDPETGYCQGMADIAAPFLVLLNDDALAFHCFCKLMSRVRRNFSVDDTGIFLQLKTLSGLLQRCDPPLFYRLRHLGVAECHFAYRMIVVLMKRELPVHQALLLWEMLWADELLQRHQVHTIPEPELPLPLSPRSIPPPPPPLSRQDSFMAATNDQGLFMYFVAAVISSQRRKILDDCHDADGVLSLFNHHLHVVKVNLWQCWKKAKHWRDVHYKQA